MGGYLSRSTTDSQPTTTTSKLNRVYGWKPDQIDTRDHHFHLTRQMPHYDFALPNQVDLRSRCPIIYDQGKLGSCTANAVAGAYQFDEMKQENSQVFLPARLFIYYNERKEDGDIQTDTGSSLREGMKVVNKYGACHEKYWPYIIEKFTEQPEEQAYKDGLYHRGLKYERINQDLLHLKKCLADGYPFVFGFLVFSSFESDEVAKTGIMPLPSDDDQILGGHAVMAVGYDDHQSCFIIRNSWGSKWGAKGYFYMPYDFITRPKWAEDFWCLQTVDRSAYEEQKDSKEQLEE